ncbi:hypothetical protein CBR_g23804 [Chara braunii]|uniref:Uncharacterized protein n=1 Tax=Chara braunii TaxID=69332 RepID=A0A388JVP7_CHABU|nr:hypothetical protein CBR_g23804 [Chara braunii]|eukprot:GBG61850.1 hypothetical protein CBR_g23804 [Chara braunii]
MIALVTGCPKRSDAELSRRRKDARPVNSLALEDGWTSDPVEQVRQLKLSFAEFIRSKVASLEVEVQELRLREKKLRESLHDTRDKLIRSGTNSMLHASLRKEEQLLEVQLERATAQKKLLKEKIRWLRWET